MIDCVRLVDIKELELLSQQDCVRFALFCAEQTKDGWRDIPECVLTIEIVERWLEGKVTLDECIVAMHDVARVTQGSINAVYYAIRATVATMYSAGVATEASIAASYYAAKCNRLQRIEEQWKYYEELLYFDDIAERALLGEIV